MTKTHKFPPQEADKEDDTFNLPPTRGPDSARSLNVDEEEELSVGDLDSRIVGDASLPSEQEQTDAEVSGQVGEPLTDSVEEPVDVGDAAVIDSGTGPADATDNQNDPLDTAPALG